MHTCDHIKNGVNKQISDGNKVAQEDWICWSV